ncbi:protein Wnt-8b-like [Dermacentor andersoni]|uniref:protein Wnt-8b-like n=1 Tax=Dermacentor andersoni TaxID=34620 RepID=UPI003B3A5783
MTDMLLAKDAGQRETALVPREPCVVWIKATRESAFVVAMVSAGITHMFARNCSRGQKSCRCDERPRKREPDSSWSWGGCSADIKYAGDFSRRLLIGKVEAIRDLNAAMNRHNNNVGRAAVRKSLLRACKCHGPSGTCTTKTCWLQPGELSAVGRRLRKAYDRAHLVKVNRGVPKWPDAKRVLVYAVPADNYCLPNRSLDTTGTYGRECSRRTGSGVSRTERDSCRNLCYDCGYGVRQVAVTTRSSCNCRFLWCCSVKCDSCDVNVTKYFCH